MVDIERIEDNIINGLHITRTEAEDIVRHTELDALCTAADRIRSQLCGDEAELCSIISGIKGRCSEDCKFCAQSHICTSEPEKQGFISEEECIKAYKAAEENGIARFSVVTAGRTLSNNDYKKAVEVYRAVGEACHIGRCASHGLLTKEQLAGLKEVGVTRYHANIETSERYFPYICTTHTFTDKLRVIRDAQAVGLSVCSGGIFGIGETMSDRVDMAFTLRELGIMSIPLNIYLPVEGTHFTHIPPLGYEEILRSTAIFRLVNPKAHIRLAAGRRYMSDGGIKAFKSGANAAITGDMLTTVGTGVKGDIKLLTENGFKIGAYNG